MNTSVTQKTKYGEKIIGNNNIIFIAPHGFINPQGKIKNDKFTAQITEKIAIGTNSSAVINTNIDRHKKENNDLNVYQNLKYHSEFKNDIESLIHDKTIIVTIHGSGNKFSERTQLYDGKIFQKGKNRPWKIDIGCGWTQFKKGYDGELPKIILAKKSDKSRGSGEDTCPKEIVLKLKELLKQYYKETTIGYEFTAQSKTNLIQGLKKDYPDKYYIQLEIIETLRKDLNRKQLIKDLTNVFNSLSSKIKKNYPFLYENTVKEYGLWKKAIQSTSFVNLIPNWLQGVFYGLFFVALGSLAVIFFKSLKYPLEIAAYFGISIIGIIIILFRSKRKEFITNKTEFFTVISGILTPFILFMTFFVASKGYELTSDINKPHLNIQITNERLPFGNYREEYSISISKNQLNQLSLKVPVYFKITNYGSVNTMINTIRYSSNCIDKDYSIEIALPENKSTVIKPGESYETNTELTLGKKNKKIIELVPCYINFEIYGPNFDAQKRSITIFDS